ncbi:TRAP transporter large permease [Nitratireductor pacificus]|uniref:TRAP transporter large permease protein n=1 Tax=Nitratireductor pacificus pht-3B TaxID=391937 RepID=K2MHH7_9HYPH|nr:TRAP transporter large permease [Nitratireductor pacificus]EKF20170.1 TRAP dicarboxylate transporter subunit DctM [Nitratireductor pacificus pht-3B]
MSATMTGLAGFAALFVLMGLGMPVGIAMLLVGFVGIVSLSSLNAAAYTISGQAFEIASMYDLSVLPLFILMGNLASASGLSRDLYTAAYSWFGHRKGGLAGATVLGCAGFAALSGSSIASAVTMGRVAYPEMRRFNYGSRLSTGVIAAGGTLGILIPPSTGFVMYAILTEQSIGRLFMAGVLPGILLTALFLLVIALIVHFRPAEGPAGPLSSTAERLAASRRALGILTIIVLTIGGIYTGVFTPVEAAGVGAAFALVMLVLRRQARPEVIRHVVLETLQTSGMCFLILIGASAFSPFIALSELPRDAAAMFTGLGLGPYGTIILLLIAYAVLGMFIEGLSLLVITLPIVFPVIMALGFDPIWFGVIMVVVLEMGLISPPVGVNCFVVKTVADDVKLQSVFAGVMPFWAAMMVCLAMLIAFPQIALLLPNAMF